MNKRDVIALQNDLNRFTRKYLKGLGPLQVDGELGPSTVARIKTCKFMLGYKLPIRPEVNADFRNRLSHPRSRKYSSVSRLARAQRRRIAGRARWAASKAHSHVSSGVTTFDGRPIAAWIKPYLVWARANGWRGTVNSGWRSPAYSASLCQRICNAPRCPGLCAGASSNHSGSSKPAGAVDVSDYGTFGRLMHSCPYSPALRNALPRDPVHYSATGG